MTPEGKLDDDAKTVRSKPRWRHKKSGTICRELGRGMLRSNIALIYGVTLVAYMGENGLIEFRTEKEFEDGRFEQVSTMPNEADEDVVVRKVLGE